MSRKIIITLAAIASLGVAALVTSTTDADASRNGASRGGGGGNFSRATAPRRVATHPGRPGVRPGVRPGRPGIHRPGRPGFHRPGIHRHGFHRHGYRHGICRFPGRCWVRPVHHCRHFPWHRHCRIHVGWRVPVAVGIGAVGIGAIGAGPVAAAPAAPCTCLSKEYTQDGLVVFKDNCTQEFATAPAGGQQSSQGPAQFDHQGQRPY